MHANVATSTTMQENTEKPDHLYYESNRRFRKYASNFAKSWSNFKILSPLTSFTHLRTQQSFCNKAVVHDTFKMSLQFLVK